MPKADEPADFTSHHVLPVSVAETVGGQIKLDTTTSSIVHWRSVKGGQRHPDTLT